MKLYPNKKLAEEVHKPITRKFDKRKVHSTFIDNIWGTDLEDIQLISKFNKDLDFLCVFDIYSKYTWVILLKDKKGITISNALQKHLNESNRKRNKLWVDKGSEFYKRSKKSFLQNNDIEMHSTHNEGKSIIAERFLRTLKNKTYKYMTSISKNVYIDKLHALVNKCCKIKHIYWL